VLTVDANTFVGVTELVADRSTGGLKFDNVGKADVSVVGNSTVTNAAVTIDVGATIVTDAFTLNFKDGTKGTNSVNVADGEADWTEVTINSTGAANATGTMNLSGTSSAATHTIKTLTINAATNLTIGTDDTTVDITGFDTAAGVTNTIKVNGAATSVKINDVAATIDVIDASGLTAGGLTGDTEIPAIEGGGTCQVHVDKSKVNIHRRHGQPQLEDVDCIPSAGTDQEAETSQQPISSFQLEDKQQQYQSLRQKGGQCGPFYSHHREGTDSKDQQRVEQNVTQQSCGVKIKGDVASP